jgi:PAS domain S-box-containing protein
MTESNTAQIEKKPKLSNIEKKRIEELYEYDILDTEQDLDFDSLAELATKILNTPAAQINFIDTDRQWSKSSIGVEMDNIPRSVSFCAHTIQQDSHLIIPDTYNDERFKDFPFVTNDPSVRFYAGVAIKGSRGNNIGSMCVVDVAPRELSADELESLKILAREVETRLNLQKSNRELKQSNVKLQQTTRFLDNSADLMFLIDPDRFRILSINPEISDILGFEQDQIEDQPFAVFSLGNEFLEELNQWADGSRETIFQVETQFLNHANEPVWFQVQISQKENLWYATARNIQDRKIIEKKHGETLKVLKNAQRIANVGHWEWYPDLDVLTWSDELHRIMGTSTGSFTPCMDDFYQKIHPEDRQIVKNAIDRIVGGGSLVPFEHRCVLDNGDVKYVMERGEVTRDEQGKTIRVSGILQDITTVKKNEIQLSESLKEKEVMLSEIHHRVKNNIAVISGILQLELQEIDNESISTILNSINTRIKSMVLVHENLYQSDSFTSVPFGNLLDSLVDIVLASQSLVEAPRIMVQSADVQLNINQAIPLALSINHLLFNCFNDRATPIEIRLLQQDNTVIMEIQREGRESLFQFDENRRSQVDLSIMLFENLLKQLEASYTVHASDSDNTLTISFEKSNRTGSSAGPFSRS